ncbi:hypothetical protein BDQ12DRAFT_692260 [Crucibulum laeve]|uniref:Uncharacterized protein n=1 Tax=Crucibulum laeve TaxID=68775 RepID=A0A5C3LIW8_9AGAR|nr:hypothetical protein BDQ12DRAFT_692260 [Crucibulum laeve]
MVHKRPPAGSPAFVLRMHSSRQSGNSWGWGEEGDTYSMQSRCPGTREDSEKRSGACSKSKKVDTAVPGNLQKARKSKKV